MKVIAILGLILIGSVSSASSNLSDPFSFGIISRVCIKGKCQNYSQIFTTQAEMKEESNKPGSYVGKVGFTYEIEGVKLVSSVTIYEFEYSGNHQINLFLKTSEENSSTDLGSSEIIVKKMSDLNSIAQYSVPIVRAELKIEPVILIGPSMDAVKSNLMSLFR